MLINWKVLLTSDVSLGDRTWFNLRPSNTEPLLRLNVEALTLPAMIRVRDEILDLLSRYPPPPGVASRRGVGPAGRVFGRGFLVAC